MEAKANYLKPASGLQQAKEYAEILGLKFAYATNGMGIVEFDFTAGSEAEAAENLIHYLGSRGWLEFGELLKSK